MVVQESAECFFQWKALTPSDVILFLTVVVALFGPRLWKCVDDRRNTSVLSASVIQLLVNLKQDLVRIRDERNGKAGVAREDSEKIEFSATSIGEVSHYFYVFEDIVMPNLVALRLPRNSLTVELFDHYRKNIEVCKSKGHLSYATVTLLLSRVDAAIHELSEKKKYCRGVNA